MNIRFELLELEPLWKKLFSFSITNMAKKKGGEDLNCLIKLFIKGFECLYQYNLKSNLRNYYEI